MFLNYSHLYDELLKLPLFKNLDLKILSKIFPYIYEQEIVRGNYIYRSGDEAKALYIVVSGSVMLFSNTKAMRHLNNESHKKDWIIGSPIYDELGLSKIFGEEVSIENYRYRCNSFALVDTRVVVIPKNIILDICFKDPEFKENLILSMVNHYSLDPDSVAATDVDNEEVDFRVEEDLLKETKPQEERHSSKKEEDYNANKKGTIGLFFSWFVFFIIPLVVYQVSGYYEIEWKQKFFLLILTMTVLMWILRLVPEFVANLFSITSIVIADVVPSNVVFSGFTSGSFYMALSVYGMALFFENSGLTYRCVLYLLKIVPRYQIFYLLASFFLCFLIVPIFPSANGRVILMSPLLIDMLQSFRYKKKKAASNLMALVVFNALTIFSGGFLSSKLIHFAVYGLFSTQVADQFDWMHWFMASLAYIAFVAIGFWVIAFLICGNREQVGLSKHQISSQLKILGPMRYHEWACFFIIAFFIIGIITNFFHQISIAWLALFILVILLGFNFITKSNFKSKIDWVFLIYLGTLLGIVKSMEYLGFNHFMIYIFEYPPFTYAIYFMKYNFALFIIIMGVFIGFLRFFIPNNAVAILMVSIFIPLGREYGINEWVLAFIILALSDNWIFPYQSTYFNAFLDSTASSGYYNVRLVTWFSGFLMSIVKILGLVFSIPYWNYLGII